MADANFAAFFIIWSTEGTGEATPTSSAWGLGWRWRWTRIHAPPPEWVVGAGLRMACGGGDLHQVDDEWQRELLLLEHRLGVDVEVIQDGAA